MIEIRKDHSARAQASVVKAMVGVAVFAALFLGICVGLDRIAPSQPSDVTPTPAQAASSTAAPSASAEAKPAYTAEQLNVPVKPFYILLIGSDSRKGTALYTGKANEHGQVDQHADVMTLVRVDPQTYTITLVTVPRDTVLEENGAKINDALLKNNPKQVVEAVAELTGVRADFYMMITFTAFEKLIDALGGITVDVPKTITVPDPATGDNLTVKAGQAQKLDGAQALVLSRARKEYETDQDALRQVNVRNVEKALIEKVLSSHREVDIRKMVDAVLSGVTTNLSIPQAMSLLRDFVRHADQLTVYECTGPYEGAERTSDELWVVDRDSEAWAQVMELVNAGEDPSQVVPAPQF